MPRHRHLEDEEFDEALTPRDRAHMNLQMRRHFQNSIMAMVVIAAFLVVVWGLSGAGYFWPGWIIAAFAVLTILRYVRHRRGPITEDEISKETDRMTSGR
jgi:uncharacterized membrane protein YiaA